MRRLAILGVGAVLVGTSCGIAGDAELQEIDTADLFGLDATTTSTSSTSSVPATVPVAATDQATSTTIVTEQVVLYFVDGRTLTDVSREIARGPSPSSPLRVVTALLDGPPPGEFGIGLRSLLTDDLVNSVVASGTGFVTVDLAGEAFQRIDPADQRSAIGQLVLTLTERPGIGQVRFTLDGEPMRVPRRDGLQSEPGESVSRLDYQSLLDLVEPGTTRDRARRDRGRDDDVGPLSQGPSQYRRSTRSGRRCQSLSTLTRSARYVPSGSWARARCPTCLRT